MYNFNAHKSVRYNRNENDKKKKIRLKKYLLWTVARVKRTPYNGTKFTYSRISTEYKILHFYVPSKNDIIPP